MLKTISAANLKLKSILKYKRCISLKTRSKVMNAHILSLFNYGMEQYLGEVEKLKQRLHSSMMQVFRKVRGFSRYREANNQVVEDLGVELPIQLLLKNSVKFIHKVAYTNKPEQITKLMRLPTWRKEGNISPTYFPKKTKFQRNFINEAIRLYNSVDPEVRKLKPSRFKREIKKWTLFEQPKNHQEPLIKAVKKINTTNQGPKRR